MWQNETFLKDVKEEDVFFISCKPSGKNVYGWNTTDDYHSCPLKYICFFKNMNIDYDWYVFIDDDTYMNTEELNKYLSNFDTNELLYIGSSRYDMWEIHYMSGGAGFCLSNKLYKLVTQFVREKPIPEIIFNYNGDVTLGSWVNRIPDVKHINDDRFRATNHENEEQLKDFISFHYLKTREQFEFYYNIQKNR
jgi:hypothetical protein